MPQYLSGAEALADARIRVTGLPPDAGVLFLEGGNDVRLFAPRLIGLELVIACGNKPKLLEAFDRLRPGEESKFVFVCDCDYDVPVGLVAPEPNLIVTSCVDVESDLLDLGLLRHLIAELVPSALSSDKKLDEVTDQVTARAEALAEAIGKFRQVSVAQELGLSFKKIRYRRYRTKLASDADVSKLARTLRQTNPDCELDAKELKDEASKCAGGRRTLHGKDLLGAVEAVLRTDFGVESPAADELARLLRAYVATETFNSWSVAERIRRWEAASGRRILRT